LDYETETSDYDSAGTEYHSFVQTNETM